MIEKRLVSVILPNYNHSLYLRKRINSILNQSFQDFELIILDDKSPDNSVEIIEEYRNHERVSHMVINEQNSGSTFNQWDKGFSLASGKYIWIAESDDYAEPTFLEKCVAALNSNERAALCFTDSNFVDENDNNVESWIENLIIKEHEKNLKDNVAIYNGAEFIRDYLLEHNYLYNASMILFRRDAIDDISDYYRCFKGAGDWVFWTEMILKKELMHVPQRLNSFRQHINKVSQIMESGKERYFEASSIKLYSTTIVAHYFELTGRGNCKKLAKSKMLTISIAKDCLSSYLEKGSMAEEPMMVTPSSETIKKKVWGGLFSVLRRPNKMKLSLLGLIPLYKIKYKLNKEHHYLFGFFPLIKIK